MDESLLRDTTTHTADLQSLNAVMVSTHNIFFFSNINNTDKILSFYVHFTHKFSHFTHKSFFFFFLPFSTNFRLYSQN